jgi:drug/metabolite transporter (DMT)-like permease
LLVAFKRLGGSWFAPTQNARLNLIRGVVLMCSGLVNFYALKILPLAVAVSINFAAPLLSCAFAHIFLGERVGLRRWLAVIVGFVGVLIVMRPGSASFHPAMLGSLFNAFLMAVYQIITRKVGFKDEVETGLLWVFAVGLFLTSLWVPFGWQMPTAQQWPILLVIGTAGLGTHILVSRALQMAEASLLAPLIYTQLIWMTALGIILFGQWPDHWTMLGAAVIIASGIYIWHRERKRAQPAAV